MRKRPPGTSGPGLGLAGPAGCGVRLGDRLEVGLPALAQQGLRSALSEGFGSRLMGDGFLEINPQQGRPRIPGMAQGRTEYQGVTLPARMSGQGHAATATQGARHGALGMDRKPGRAVHQGLQEAGQRRILRTDLDPQGPLTCGREHVLGFEDRPDALGQAQTLKACRASTMASYCPSSSFLNRVSRLPRSGSMRRSGRKARNITTRRRLEVPTQAPCGKAARFS